MKISAIIPAYNEEERIGRTIEALSGVSEIDEVIVVDDGSWDDTSRKAREAGADVVLTLAGNRGKGEALLQGVRAAAGDVLCFVDADLGMSAGEFAGLLPPVLSGEADMTVAAWPRARRRAGLGLVKGMASLGIRLLTGFRADSPLSGQRVLRREVWDKASGVSGGFGVEVALTVECLRHGFKLLEVPLAMTHRETGRSLPDILHRGRQFVQVGRTLWQVWRRPKEGF